MIIAVDIGNTNIVIGAIEDGNVTKTARLHTDDMATEAEYGIKFTELFSFMKIDVAQIEGTAVASSVPQVLQPICSSLEKITGRRPLVVAAGIKTGLNIKIDDPATLGADLLVGGVAAVEYYGCPSIVLDMGTATTIFAVDKNKNFIGGEIMTGVKLGLTALAGGTSLLPDISVSAPKRVISTNTVDCMRSGAVYASASMIDGMLRRFEAELGYKCNIIATGGIARLVVPFCERGDIILDDELLLKGLWVLYKKNLK